MSPPPIPFRYPLALALGAVVWAYWTSVTAIGERCATDPQYSHGFLVPLFAAYLLWTRRTRLAGADLGPRWWGVGVVLLGASLRVVGHVYYLPWLDAASLLVVLAGFAGAGGGRPAVVWALPAVAFLAFMIPLPHRFESLLGGTAQRVATLASTYALQTLGVPAVAEGNIILLTETRLGIVEACSGLTMLVTFVAMSVAVAMLARRAWWERAVVVLSAVPIAVMANVARITLTGVLYEAHQGDLARAVFHDLAGWLMMPLALAALIAELSFLGRAFPGVGPAPEGSAPVP